MARDQENLELVADFRGRYRRQTLPNLGLAPIANFELADSVPNGFAIDERNCQFFKNGVGTRPGTTNFAASGFNVAANAKRIFYFRLTDNIDRFLLLEYSTGTGNGILSLFLPGSGTSTLLTLAGMTDFTAVVMYDRVYVTPHNRVRGLVNAAVYVLVAVTPFPAGIEFRKAAGLRATDGGAVFAAATSAAAGTVEVGVRIISYCFETTSGFRTKPLADPIVYNGATASRKITLTNYDVGPAGTAKRVFLASKLIPFFDPLKAKDYELFFVPNGIIADNVTVAAFDIDFFDAQLVDSADYLTAQLEEIPAGVNLTDYHARLVVGGISEDTLINGVASRTNAGTLRISKEQDPESMSTVDGFKGVDPNFGGGIKNAKELSGNLYCFKSFRTYGISDNGGPPNSWPHVLIDAGRGAECYSLGMVLGTPGETLSLIFVGARDGLYAFNGSYGEIPLVQNIQGVWDELVSGIQTIQNPAIYDFSLTKVKIDSVAKRIYFTMHGLDGPTTYIATWVGDYKDGLSPDTIKWSEWVFGDSFGAQDQQPIDIELAPPITGTVARFMFIKGNTGQISLLSPRQGDDDDGTLFEHYYQTHLVQPDPNGSHQQFSELRFLVTGDANEMVVDFWDGSNPSGGPIVIPSLSFGTISALGKFFKQIIDIKGRGLSLKFTPTGIGSRSMPVANLFRITLASSYFAEAEESSSAI